MRTIKVSMNTPTIATQPCSWGFFTNASACAWGVEPIPASLENRPLFAPWLTAVLIAIPNPPPIIAWGWNAYLKIRPKVSGIYWSLIASTPKPPIRKNAAMTGTNFSVTEARRSTPPMKINPQIITRKIPTIQDGIPNAIWIVDPIELDCTMQPKNPRARIIAIEKKPARNLPNLPLKAVWI